MTFRTICERVARYNFIYVAVLAALAYLLTMAPTMSWANGSADSGELATAARYWGVMHPTGYPLYTVLGAAFGLLPFGDFAFRTNLLSATAAALAAGVMALLVTEHTAPLGRWPSAAGALLAALLFAFSPMLWSQAVVTEVYTLNILALVTVCYCAERAQRAGASPAALLPLAVVAGAALAHHATSALLVGTVGVRLLVALRLWRRPAAIVVPALTAVAVMLAAFALLPWRAASAPAFAVWGDVTTLQGLLDHITAASYRPALFSLGAAQSLLKIPALARMLLDQLGMAGYVLMLCGLWWWWRSDRPQVLWWLVTALAFIVFAIDYPVLDSQVYLLPFFTLAFWAAGVGAAVVLAEIDRRARRPLWRRWLPGIACAALAAGACIATAPRVSMAGNHEAVDFAHTALADAPPAAILISREDGTTFSLWYAQHVEGLRPDVRIIDNRVITAPWYRHRLPREYPDLVVPPDDQMPPLYELSSIIAANPAAPVVQTFESPVSGARRGSLWELDRTKLPPLPARP